MEGPKELCERIENDVDKILKMYDLAAKTYPYANVHGGSPDNENQRRIDNVKFLTSENPDYLLMQGSPLPLVFVYLMSRPGAKGLFDFSQLFAKPSRALGWFFLGNSIMSFWKINYIHRMREQNQQKSALNLRVSQNEQTHAILKTMKFHLSTRKMDVFEIDPR